jgi:DNA-binding NarL/FixJ family response regulator
MRILIVDADKALRVEIVEYLRRRGHEAVGVGSVAAARDALETMLARRRSLHAIICDVGLPHGDDVDFYIASAPLMPGCRWMLLSGGDVDQLERKLSSLVGFSPVIAEKPVALRILRQFLEDSPTS